jgi:hypothetical protein
VLSPPEHAPPAYRAVFVALAREQLDAPDVPPKARAHRYFELFGIPPSPSIVRARLGDDERHACHDTVDDQALAETTDDLLPDARTRTRMRSEARKQAVLAAESHLACDELLDARRVDGVFDTATRDAVGAYQRRHAILGIGFVDEQTRTAMLEDSRELEVLVALRMLRERVVDATGLLEDGSTSQAWQPVLGRMLDPPQLRRTLGRAPIAGAAPDRIAIATEAAARHLGWTDAAAIEASLQRLEDGCRVSVSLPPPPPWQRTAHELRVEIDRGDVWYQYPWTRSGGRRKQPIDQPPTLTVFVVHDGIEEALVRWPTTIGGWERERLQSGAIVMKYKASAPGSFVWRDVVGAPVWLPPRSTPDQDLVRRRPGGGWEAQEDAVGPGYLSAYGLAMLIHLQHVPAHGRSPEAWLDDGVRTHGTSSYLSVYGNHSHGCHRLPNHLALRLTSFILRERSHAVLGPMVGHYERPIWGGALEIRRTSRGFGYRLDEPVPVVVLEGRILGPVREPSRRNWPLPPHRAR